MCLNSNDQMANTFKWTPWTHSVFICVLLIFSKSVAGADFQNPPEHDDLVLKDSNRLLNPEILPFLKDCTSLRPSKRMLCATYYDMVYNVYQYGVNVDDVKAEIHKANQTLEKLGETFCTLFPTEVTQALDKRPFLAANRLNLTALFQYKDYCAINCISVDESTMQREINQLCKSISGGCRWILKQRKTVGSMDSDLLPAVSKIIENENTKVEDKPSANDTVHVVSANSKSIDQNAINNENQDTNTDVKVDGTINELKITNTNANADGKLVPIDPLKLNLNHSSNLNSIQNPVSMPDANQKQNQNSNPNPSDSKPINISKPLEPAQKDDKKGIDLEVVKSTENRPSTPSENKPSQSKDTYTEQREDNTNDMMNNPNENNGDDQTYDPDKPDDETEPEDLADDGHDDDRTRDQEMRNDSKNSNNMQSPLLAEAADFREDKESNFFPYFMFLMFVIVTMYVAYHNKSKILALLIEGRRSRSYSRGGRRKQHSAEYRKLDSNLEEAIQSDGSHMTSSQIIY